MLGASLTKGCTKLAYPNESLHARTALTGLRQVYFVAFKGCSPTTEVIAFDETFWAHVKLKGEHFFFLRPHISIAAVNVHLQAYRTCEMLLSKLQIMEYCGMFTLSGNVSPKVQ